MVSARTGPNAAGAQAKNEPDVAETAARQVRFVPPVWNA